MGDNVLKEIRSKLGEEELLCQLAEECAELGKAALKLRRVLSGKNPTPVTEDQARADLLEEIADVTLCLDALDLVTEENAVLTGEICGTKLARWEKRLAEKGDL
jgi:hypothetical protein